MRQPQRMPWIDNCVKTLLDNFLPWRCLVCAGTADQDYALCRGCERALPQVDPACPCCAAATPVAYLCGRCLRAPPAFDQTLAAFRYAPPLAGLIQTLKYRRDLRIAPTLGRIFTRVLLPRVAHMPDAIVPVPLHRRRLRQRGFNQALELARPLARATGVPLRFATRHHHGRPQAELGMRERRGNLRGAFGVPPRLGARRVAIVDDVMTTGATAHELAGALKRAGATHVQVWVLART